MVYRHESDEDAYEYPLPDGEPAGPVAGRPPAAGPSPSRFPTPSLPRADRLALPQSASAQPPTGRAALPAPVSSPPPPHHVHAYVAEPVDPPRVHGYATTEPLDLPRSRRAADTRGGGRLWQALVGGAAVLVLLALCGLGAAALLAGRTTDPEPTRTNQPAALPSPTTSPDNRQDLDSRDTDQTPLTVKEVFPGKALVVADGRPAYRVLKAQASTGCAVAATGEVADLLVRLGCNQVVRATLRSPDGDHLLTAGLFNLTDRVSAERTRDRIRPMLDDRQGRFRGLVAGEGTEAVARAAARVGWQVRGHYIAYCLVTRADGEAVKTGDPTAREILYDMIELYLNQGVLERRAAGGTASQPTDEPSATTDTQRGTEPDGGSSNGGSSDGTDGGN
ncbi:hypothetical protein [Micromonospora siamensis]|uniref:Uncharacterized protein n=1 Tax=Micromonospora siamensis TaxID=299152 RepID=A0A1C5K664_9ACTN|nr:hypothetical protein [Micromonospora siamensis]SCG78197.1 hypothetical protein GA0074704_5588 [Micromonospora siamensis]